MDVIKLLEELDKAVADVESIRAEMPRLEQAEKQVESLKLEIRKLVEFDGRPVAGSGWEAVFQTRQNWKAELLEGYAIAHPEVLACRTETRSVVIRRKRGGK